MDSRLREHTSANPYTEVESDLRFLDGFTFAISRLRENEYYGHYAQNLADWLELHLTQEVKGDKADGK